MEDHVLKAIMARRSVRKYTDTPIAKEDLDRVLKAGLLAPSGKDTRALELIVVQDRALMKELVNARANKPAFVGTAGAVIVVLTDSSRQDTWIEDASIAAAYMHLEADSIGLGSCWIQIHLRSTESGQSSEDFLREKLGFGPDLKPVCLLVLGNIEEHPEPRGEDRLLWDRVSYR